ncbi:MAG: SDR family oxidoreductase [Bryobacteraceae bacterium]
MNLELEGRVALVCGGSRGIGKAIAQALAREGAMPVLVSRSDRRLVEAAEEIEGATGIRPGILAGDVADSGLARASVDEVVGKHGRIDILINNAGGPPSGSFLSHAPETWDAAVETNLLSVIRFTQAAVPEMKKSGYGRVINITSFLAKEPTPGMVLSGTLRAGVSAFTKAISKELARENITANTVCPSAVLTDRAESLTREAAGRDGISFEEALKRASAALPMGRLAAPAEIADIVAFLASPLASYITGVTLLVDGGLSCSVF